MSLCNVAVMGNKYEPPLSGKADTSVNKLQTDSDFYLEFSPIVAAFDLGNTLDIRMEIDGLNPSWAEDPVYNGSS